ncbi:MAG: hypothetical protein HY245_15760 [Rhizobiales bacterium]|nr:hypothetical protein [Hyphomicrobiales bacterium]MBI3674839.1 hypothetical protein [Hyphomicrobiales bacterium]
MASEKKERARAFRDILIQLTTSIMIPLTVAGMGWYYTRWQQNLTDLKTMIDLVSDQNQERRKYGVAMFEYLLKNDKVPVEFVAAQLDYANNASDPELLGAMERALVKASQVNKNVGPVFEEAVQRLPARLFVQVLNERQRACFRQIFDQLKDDDQAAITVPSIATVKWDGKVNELRALKNEDMARAESLAGLFGGLGFPLKVVNLTDVWKGAAKVRPNTFELWFGDTPLPPACGNQGAALPPAGRAGRAG